ncbi:MAG: dihydroorotate dehydrogenase electron transfer subunit, partial [Planctomycetota bacterium]
GGVQLSLAPGQFVQAHAFSGHDPLLRRPLAPFDVQNTAKGTRVDLMIGVMGRGTRSLAALRAGDTISILGPLGNPFTQTAGAVIAVAGGVGLAPFFHLVRQARDAGDLERFEIILGARSAARLAGQPELDELGVTVHLATDDGSAGFHGNAVACLDARLDAGPVPTALLGCGPEPMLVALASLAKRRGLACEVSLERRMACGFGVCYTCVCPMRSPNGEVHNVRTCLEGPVVDASRWVPSATF